MDRRFAVASAVGGLLAALVFAVVLTEGTASNLTASQRVGDFYDAQAHAWLDGHWHISPDVLGIERFEARGQSYMYQGPTPALLRVPVAALTHRFDGRLTQLSMLLALGVLVLFITRLHWRIRSLVRGEAPVARGEAAAVAVATFAVVASGSLLFVASRAWVYHEAIMWGVALTVGALEGLLVCATEPSRRWIAWTALLATLAVSARASVGLGAVGGTALLVAGQVVRWWLDRRTGEANRLTRLVGRLRWLGPGRDAAGRLRIPALAAAAAAPVVVYAAVNWIKFRSLFSVPFDSQGISIVDPVRQHFLEANDGSFFGLQFVPTTLVQYLRPDALDLTSTFPFVDFASPTAPIGDVTFDLIDQTASLPTSMPALLIAGLVGVWALLRGVGAVRPSSLSSLRVPLLAAAGAGVTILPFGYIAQRYLADLLPLLALSALIGVQVLLSRSAGGVRRWRTVSFAALGALVVVGCWTNLSLALVYQRLYSPNVEPSVIAAFVDTRYDVSQSLGLDPAIPLRTGRDLPDTAPRGTLFVVGDCEGLYLSDGMRTDAIKHTPWNGVERGEAGGRFRLEVVFDDAPAGSREPLLSIDAGDEAGMIWAERGAGGVAIGFGGVGFAAESRVLPIADGQAHELDLLVDVHLRQIQVVVDGQRVLETIAAGDLRPTFTVGRDTIGDPAVAARFGGTLTPLPEQTRVCRELLAEADAR